MQAEHYIYLSAFFSFWGDRMWTFAIGLYLVQITPGSLQLAAIFGLVLSFTAIIFAPMVGDWIDRNARLKVIRTLILLQNMLVIVCAAIVLLYLHEVSDRPLVKGLFKALIIISGSSANLAGHSEKIALGKDWVVVISKGDNYLLTETNAMIRRIDLTVALLAPVVAGLLMTMVSDKAGIILICCWNVLTMIVEYLLLWKVYNVVPELAEKSNTTNLTNEKLNTETGSGEDINKNHAPHVKNNWNLFARFKIVALGWKVYKRQNMFLAGCALAILYLTVMGYSAVTLGYAYLQNLSKFYVSVCLGLGSLFGVFGTFLFPRIRKRIGLPKTGLVAFFCQFSMILLCALSIWLPGSPSNLYRTTSNGIVRSRSNVSCNSTLPSNISNSRVDTKENSMASISVLMAGIILSRTGLWISDLTITQLQQENVPEKERGIIGGVQYSFNCILDVVQYGLTIILPYQEQFGILILISVSAVGFSGIIYMIFLSRFKQQTDQEKAI